MTKVTSNKKVKDPMSPIIIEGRAIAKSWWGKAWNINLESYADYSSRIGRGKTYVRSGAVIDLKNDKGIVRAKVQGSRKKPYEVEVHIDPLKEAKWDKVAKLCNHRIDSLEQLILGQFPEALEVLFTDRQYGLFPAPGLIKIRCSFLTCAALMVVGLYKNRWKVELI